MTTDTYQCLQKRLISIGLELTPPKKKKKKKEEKKEEED